MKVLYKKMYKDHPEYYKKYKEKKEKKERAEKKEGIVSKVKEEDNRIDK